MKKKTGYAAMNKDDYDLENVSFYNTQRKAIQVWGKTQEIVKVTIMFHTREEEESNVSEMPPL